MKRYVLVGVAMVFVLWVSACPSGAINRISVSEVQASFIGEEAGDWADGLACVDDVNGDGYDDFLVGATDNDYGGENAGQIYLFFGRSDGWSLRASLSEADASFVGEIEGGYVGWEISGAGDVNGDGFDDILIGSANYYSLRDGPENPCGKTYLIFGKADGWQMRTSLREVDASFIGEDPGDRSGCHVTCAGDVNGDGYDDILIGAFFNSFGGEGAGQTYLIFGKPEGWRLGTKLSLADASFVGENPGDWSGVPLTGVGDVNGDGYDDILIGMRRIFGGGTYPGQTYLIFGKPDGWSMRTPLSEVDASFLGEEESDQAGVSLTGAGDVNGDGYDDFLIGSSNSSFSGFHAGQIYLIFGRSADWFMRTSLSQADASFTGEGELNFAGGMISGVTGAGDVNGDGYDDVLIGAPGYDNDTGQSYLILGRPNDWQMRMSLSAADVSFFGEDSLDSSGGSLAGGIDVNGDGFDDMLIGAIGSSEEAGQTYLCLHLPVIITSRSLKSGVAGIPYNVELDVFGGTQPYTWSLHTGFLPDGLELESTGVISGVPTSSDTANFTVQVTDAASDTNIKGFSIIVHRSVKGDVNGDSRIDFVDALFTVNIFLGLYSPTPVQLWAADCNEDEVVNILDALCLINIVLEGSGLR